jgi:NAD(P)-dependent dehydrogenase (short-subunit alcohol dehydrogenase family)
MNVKANVSSGYMSELHAEHSGKRYPTTNNILITGDKKPDSIGATIVGCLNCYTNYKLTSFYGDIRRCAISTNLHAHNALILCHGVMHLDWFENTPQEKIEEIFAVNVVGSIRLIQAFVRATLDSEERKRIIVIGSMAYNKVLNGSSIYCASKAAMAHFVRCIAWELGPKGYDVFAIHPSNVLDAPMSEETILGLMRYRNITRAAAEAYWNDGTFRDKPLTKWEIAELVHYLFTPTSAYLSGTQLELAGGAR